ncbi:hypothetical protein PROFUN_17133 [Planoprotostelium fungivorum]|uniref:Uncharacterized protein n=1 Tax=Planoprotostelium fungivorum TaxID=1890364 RepID=A0A2P6MM38_9EUKA|nr:hypothetical protein PROFUN_17133 [Planoprotostelium fungivorum]
MPTSREVERLSVRSERMILPLRLFEVAMINNGMKRTRSVLEGSGQYGPRTRIESECERGTNASKLLLPVDALVQNEVYKTAKDLKGINSC